jgi:hypothetical protein
MPGLPRRVFFKPKWPVPLNKFCDLWPTRQAAQVHGKTGPMLGHYFSVTLLMFDYERFSGGAHAADAPLPGRKIGVAVKGNARATVSCPKFEPGQRACRFA